MIIFYSFFSISFSIELGNTNIALPEHPSILVDDVVNVTWEDPIWEMCRVFEIAENTAKAVWKWGKTEGVIIFAVKLITKIYRMVADDLILIWPNLPKYKRGKNLKDLSEISEGQIILYQNEPHKFLEVWAECG